MVSLNRIPTELQVLILTNVISNTRAFLEPLTPRGHLEPPSHNFILAAAFLAARTAAPTPPPVVSTALDKSLFLQSCISDIDDPLDLRAALATALPAWRGALCCIPRLWTQIAVPIDQETWGADVLEAVSDALVCSKSEPLNLLITYTPSEAGVEDVGEQSDGVNSEHVRVAQVMALFQPHITRWRWLSVWTHSLAALPVPTIDFAGEASLLCELHLRSASPVSASVAIVSGGPGVRSLNMPQLQSLTMDAHAFRAAFLHTPNTLRSVSTLTLTGPGIEGAVNPPAMSVRALLTCTAEMQRLNALTLEGPHLSVSTDKEEEEESDTDNFMLNDVSHLHCERLSAEIIDELLSLGMDIDEDGNPETLLSLYVVACALPEGPPLVSCHRIALARIAADQNVGAFLTNAEGCNTLTINECAAEVVVKLCTQLCEPVHRKQWSRLLPQLEDVYVYDCPGVKGSMLSPLMVDRRLASRMGYDCRDLVDVMLNDNPINPDHDDEEEEEDEEDVDF